MAHEKVFIVFTCHEIPMNARPPNEKPMNLGDNIFPLTNIQIDSVWPDKALFRPNSGLI